jgi:alpha-galactosidase
MSQLFALNGTDRLSLRHFGLPDVSWALPTSPLFTIEVDDVRLTSHDFRLHSVRAEQQPGRNEQIAQLYHDALDLALNFHIAQYEGSMLAETWLTIENAGAHTRHMTRIDSLALDLPPAAYELLSFTGSWGLEFAPQHQPLLTETVLESRAGRSSKGHHPWFALVRQGGAEASRQEADVRRPSMLAGAVAWSGNWVVRLQPYEEGLRVSGGLHDWEFAVELAPGAALEAPPFVVALAMGTDLNTVSVQFGQIGRAYWYPHNPLSDQLPVEWNHWWSYEDSQIDEQVFHANVDAAAALGIEVCTLDAGWFGPSDPATHWYDYRGDWARVNAQRFPSGLRALADYVHARGMAFGLWCEIEALGKLAQVAQDQPQMLALRGGEALGYVCLGSTGGQQWALTTLDRLIHDSNCDWVKLDFNLDPGAGCDRSDHGHGAGDGLYAHYQGYYALLTEIRRRYPHVVLENCSSGGLRIDLGIARQTHMAFLSDPDWPEHSLQCFWGASVMLAPDALLHWGYCEWSITEHRHQKFDPRDPTLKPHQLDYYTRISMLRRFGFSQRLPELPASVAARYGAHIADYKTHVRRFVQKADLLRLSAQPEREGLGARRVAFQYAMPDASEHLLAVFRLPGGAADHIVIPQKLDLARRYTLSWLGEERVEQHDGNSLIERGLCFDTLPEEGSALILIR